MKRSKRLTAAFVRTIETPGRFGDGGYGSHGLSLLVKKRKHGGVARSWSQRLWIDGKAVNIGLGSALVVTLSRARQKALANRRSLEQGHDPRRRSTAPTFEQATERTIELRAPGWRGGKNADQWRASLAAYAYPVIGKKSVDEVTSADVLSILAPIWHTKAATAARVKGRISSVMKWAIAQRYRSDDPARDVAAALPKTNGATEHHEAVGYADVPDVLRRVQECGASLSVRLAFRFLTLTAARSGEARLATWNEIDMGAALWRIPASRMKAGAEHEVPMSRQAVEVMKAAKAIDDGAGYVFPSAKAPGQPLGRNAFTELMSSLSIRGTAHGQRSAFKDWAFESGQPRDLAEQSLAHAIGNTTERAYLRTSAVEQRRRVLQDWADYCAPTD